MTLNRDQRYQLAMKAIGYIGDILRLRHRVIFCLHSVTHKDSKLTLDGRMAITSDFLEKAIIDLRRRGIVFISLAEALRRIQEGENEPFVALTFDDGYRDNYEVAYPILLRNDVPFTVFVTTGLLDRNVPMWWHVLEQIIQSNAEVRFSGLLMPTVRAIEKDLAYFAIERLFRQMHSDQIHSATESLIASNQSTISVENAYKMALDWSMVREMAASGLVCFGCHTISHPMLCRLNNSDLQTEIAGSRERLASAAGIRAEFFAYPFGRGYEVGPDAPRIVKEAGFTAAFTTESSVLRPSHLTQPYSIPRVMVAGKAQNKAIVRAYVSGLPFRIRQGWNVASKA